MRCGSRDLIWMLKTSGLAGGESPPADNEEPELDAYLNGTAVYGPIQAASDTA